MNRPSPPRIPQRVDSFPPQPHASGLPTPNGADSFSPQSRDSYHAHPRDSYPGQQRIFSLPPQQQQQQPQFSGVPQHPRVYSLPPHPAPNYPPPHFLDTRRMSKLRTAPPGVTPTLHPKITEYRQQLQKQKGLVSEIAFGDDLGRDVRLKIHRAFSAVEPFAVMDYEYTGVLQSQNYISLKRLSEDLEGLLVKWYPVSVLRVRQADRLQELMPKVTVPLHLPHPPHPPSPDLKETESGRSAERITEKGVPDTPKRGGRLARLLCR